MDKILTRKILGLKIGDILKCVILVVIGYCIAVMLGNCNCVEGYFVCSNKRYCTPEECGLADGELGDCNQDICPGWMVSDFGDGTPEVFAPREIYECNKDPTSAVGYETLEACQEIANDEGMKQYHDVLPDIVTTLPPCPNITPTPPAPPPPPTPTPPTPTPPTPTPTPPTKYWSCPGGNNPSELKKFSYEECTPSSTYTRWNSKSECEDWCRRPNPPPPPTPPPTPPVCTYSGDKHTGTKDSPLNQEWWKKSADRCESCSTNITNCREEMKNYLQYVEGVESEKLSEAYNGFCLQTVGESVSGERGDCGRIPLTKQLHKDCDTSLGSDACIDDQGQPIYIANPEYVSEEGRACKKYRDGSTFADMAWVEDSLDLPCNPNCPKRDECPPTAPSGCQSCEKLGACNERVEMDALRNILCCEDSSYWQAAIATGGDEERPVTCNELENTVDNYL